MEPIFVLLGAPGAGKTTISRALLARFALAYHVEVDRLREGVVSGIAHPVPEWTEETTRQFELAEQAAADLAVRYHDAGFAVAIDHLHNPASIERNLVARLGNRPVYRIGLVPRLEVCLERNRARTNKEFDTAFLEPAIRGVYKDMEAMRDQQGEWRYIDSSDLDVEATVDRILPWAPRAT